MDKNLEDGYRDLLDQVFQGRASDQAGEDQSDQQPPEPPTAPPRSSENTQYMPFKPRHGMSPEIYRAYKSLLDGLNPRGRW